MNYSIDPARELGLSSQLGEIYNRLMGSQPPKSESHAPSSTSASLARSMPRVGARAASRSRSPKPETEQRAPSVEVRSSAPSCVMAPAHTASLTDNLL